MLISACHFWCQWSSPTKMDTKTIVFYAHLICVARKAEGEIQSQID